MWPEEERVADIQEPAAGLPDAHPGVRSTRLGWWKHTRTYGLSRRQLGWLLFLPSVAVLIFVVAYPAGRTVYTSMTTDRLDMPWLGQPFTGLRNYHLLGQEQDFWNSLEMSAYFTVGAVVSELLLGMITALVVNRQFRGRGLMRAAMLVPWAIPVVLTARLFQFMYNADYGPISAVLQDLHVVSSPLRYPEQQHVGDAGGYLRRRLEEHAVRGPAPPGGLAEHSR